MLLPIAVPIGAAGVPIAAGIPITAAATAGAFIVLPVVIEFRVLKGVVVEGKIIGGLVLFPVFAGKLTGNVIIADGIPAVFTVVIKIILRGVALIILIPVAAGTVVKTVTPGIISVLFGSVQGNEHTQAEDNNKGVDKTGKKL